MQRKKICYNACRLFLILLLFSLTSKIQSQTDLITKAADKQADLTVKVIKEHLPPGSKLAVLNFGFANAYSDTVRTKTGVAFSRLYTQSLQKKIQKAGLSYIILTPNQTADDVSASYNVGGETHIHDYYKKFLDNITPDYIITGSWTHHNYERFITQNIKIRGDRNKLNNAEYVVQGINLPTDNAVDRSFLIETEAVGTPEGLAAILTAQIMSQTDIRNIKLSPPLHSASESATELSFYISDLLEQELIQKGKYSVKRNAKRGLIDGVDETEHVLESSYNIRNDTLWFNFRLINDKTKSCVSSSNLHIPVKEILNRNLKFEPENKEIAEERKTILEKDTVKNTFEINLWTNKGNDNPKFKEGEILELTVLSAEACYLRFVYILADGTAVLLLDNVNISNEKAGKRFTLPQQFECAEPFGTETLMLFAQTGKPFDHLLTHTSDGYTFIDESFSEMLNRNRRGFKQVNKHAEKTIHIFTAEN